MPEINSQDSDLKGTHSNEVSRRISFDLKKLALALSKAFVDAATGNWVAFAKDAVDGVAALGLKPSNSSSSLLLIRRSYLRAIAEVLRDQPDVVNASALVPDTDLAKVVGEELASLDAELDVAFARNPRDSNIAAALSMIVERWLTEAGIPLKRAAALSQRTRSYFIYSLHQEWREHSSQYSDVEASLQSPFWPATELERAWQRYAAWLDTLMDQNLLSETFSINQVYVPLRGYWIEDIIQEHRYTPSGHKYTVSVEHRRVADAEGEIVAWLRTRPRSDTIRIICGGPGSGKSTFAKRIASVARTDGTSRVVLVPIKRLHFAGELMPAIASYLQEGFGFPSVSLLDSTASLTLILDGLDEVAAQGEVGTAAASSFFEEVLRIIDTSNEQRDRLRVIITGRDMMLPTIAPFGLRSHQIISLLPYVISSDPDVRYAGARELVELDQRPLWLEKYHAVVDDVARTYPDEVEDGLGVDVTAQPLLNYLIHTMVRPGITLGRLTDLAAVYENLVVSVYARIWGDGQHRIVRSFRLSQDDYFAALEHTAIATWTRGGICDTSTLFRGVSASTSLHAMEAILGKRHSEFSDFLICFYFTPTMLDSQGAVEFSHKSFEEYLVARWAANTIAALGRDVAPLSTPQATEQFMRVFGQMRLDTFVFNYLRAGLSHFDKDVLARAAQRLIDVSEHVSDGMTNRENSLSPTYTARELHNLLGSVVAMTVAASNASGHHFHVQVREFEPIAASVQSLYSRSPMRTHIGEAEYRVPILGLGGCTIRVTHD